MPFAYRRAVHLSTSPATTALAHQPARSFHGYRPRRAETTVLHRVVREHLLTFLEHTSEASEGRAVPMFVERELRRFVDCGVLAEGFARLRCDDCDTERLLPFSAAPEGPRAAAR